ncbi:patatin-like protein [Geodermatophilus poikilotrophus]|uniref:Patatin-related protein n=1 Tax=Geodermatophilus poikilotrophus TaxID=1333667 RepID=A0A1H9Z1D4_9ACTN|nr:patatin-like protein [Geodermatophilus poikilotrophus]SES75332.1 patatin-related protein [Geodermatophilus poikilotrophus]
MATKPELRLALAMRGGVSLAVWMGGACSEVDRMRRASLGAGPQTSTYGRMLDAAGYGSVAVDVLAGASAGGLNCALMSCSVVYGMPFDGRIRDLWLRLGDIGRLRRRAGLRSPVSLLDGDRAFYGALAPQLLDLVGQVDAPPGRARLDTVLTGTLFSPVPRTRYQDLGPPLVERRNRAWFRFRHLGRDLSDFPDQPPDRDEALRRLAYAARATSSFPGAFEPASVGFTPPGENGDPPAGLPGTHYGTFSESRTRDGEVDRDHVIDGGVLDNIPVAWAIRSIAAAPADTPVHRWLVYLQPVPFEAPSPAAKQGRADLLTTVRRARSLQGGTEVLADDLDELETLQRRALTRQGFRQVLEYALGQVPSDQTRAAFLSGLYERALAAVPDYRQRAGLVEASRVRALWIDPLPVLGADPLGFRGTTRTPLACCADPTAVLATLPAAGPELVLSGETPAGEPRRILADLGPRFRSPQVLARTVAVLLDGARELGEQGLKVKGDLYQLRSRIEALVAEADRRLAAAPTANRGLEDAEELVRRAAAATAGADEGWPTWDTLWQDLVAQAQALAAAAGNRPVRAFLGCLVGAAAGCEGSDEATAAVLAATELLTGPLRPDPLAETAPVRFHMLSAQNQSPLVSDPDGKPFSVGDKLAGNQLRNFAAFLSARWRLNDWTWGRLDAACSLVDIVTEPRQGEDVLPALRDIAGLPEAAELAQVRDVLVRQLHDEILREELPQFSGLGAGPPPDHQAARPALRPGACLDTSSLLEAGRATVPQLVRGEPGRLPVIAGLVVVGAHAVLGSLTARAVGHLRGNRHG